MNDRRALYWAYETADARVLPAGRPAARRGERGHDGGRIHVLCPARAGPVGAPAGSARPAGHRGTAAGLGRRSAADPGSAPPPRLHRQGPAGLHGAGRRDRWPDHAVHARDRAHPARHRQRAGVPRATDDFGARARRRAQALGGPGRNRRGAADPALDRRHRPRRPWLRTRSRGLLGHLHPADPARRRPGHRPQRAGRLHPGGRHRGAACRRFLRTARGDLAVACRHAGAGRAASRAAVQPGTPRPAASHRQRLRHPDEPGTRHRPAGRPARPWADPERGSRRRRPLRGHRRNRGHPHRRPNAPAPRPPRRHACPRTSRRPAGGHGRWCWRRARPSWRSAGTRC
jgi:hypothetical protein